MSDETENQEPEMTEEEQLQAAKDELKLLKERAAQIGVAFSPNIGLEKLREKVNARLSGKSTEDEVPEKKANETKIQRRNRLRKQAEKMVRVRVTCMNPTKRDYQGELFTVGNTLLGTYRRMIPFGVDWHVPQIMLNMLKERKYQIFRKHKTNGVEHKSAEFTPEFAIQELPDLTKDELKELAQRQQMAGGTSQ